LLTESFISPPPSIKYSLDRISLFGSKLLDFAMGEHNGYEPNVEGPSEVKLLDTKVTEENVNFPAFQLPPEVSSK
jgi:hypothetical protein